MQTVLATDFPNYVKGIVPSRKDNIVTRAKGSIGQQFSEFMQSVLGTGVFNSDGKCKRPFHYSIYAEYSRLGRGHVEVCRSLPSLICLLY